MTQTALDDVGHWWGDDIELSPTGDLARVSRADRSRQRVLRRLLTSTPEYIFHPGYGAGVPKKVGENLDLAAIRGLVRGQMLREASVARDPEPKVVAREVTGGVQVNISYVALPDRQPVSLSFIQEI